LSGMRWFRRRRPEPEPVDERDPQEVAVEFWQGWVDFLPTLSAALGDNELHRVENDLCELVARLHPDLHFSVERGQRAIYALVLSGQEDPGLRPYTDAWKAAAPPEDAIWEFHDSVPPVPDPTQVTVNLGTKRIPLADVRVAVHVDGDVVDVTVYHPMLVELEPAAREALTYLPLDATLGERVAGERLRRVETSDVAPEGAVGLLRLREIVGGLG
jgi:hypothetical protein